MKIPFHGGDNLKYLNFNCLQLFSFIVNISEMDKLRKEAREALVLNPGKMPVGFFPAVAAASKSDLGQLWQDIAAYDHSTHLNVCFCGFDEEK